MDELCSGEACHWQTFLLQKCRRLQSLRTDLALAAPQPFKFTCPQGRTAKGLVFLPPHCWVVVFEDGGLRQELACPDADVIFRTNHMTSYNTASRRITSPPPTHHGNTTAVTNTPPPGGTAEAKDPVWASRWLVASRLFSTQSLSFACIFFSKFLPLTSPETIGLYESF